MALSQWGRWADQIDPIDRALLAQAYSRRRQWEDRQLAIAIINAYGEAMNHGRKGKGAGPRKVPLGFMLGKMGMNINGD